MRHVAIMNADFAPSSLPPALRVRFFAKHLPEFGWEPTVITTHPSYYESTIDPENERLLPDALEVIRTSALPARVTRNFGFGELGIRSMFFHWRALTKLARERRVDALLIPVPPTVPMTLGRLAYHRFGIPYVIDYIDPWVTEYYRGLPKAQRPPKWRLAYTAARILEPFSIKRASQITGVSKGVTDSVISRYSQFKESDATEIPYGGEADDLAYVKGHPRPNMIFDKGDGLLHISYVGVFATGMAETVRAIFTALKVGLRRAPEQFGRVRLHFVGTTYDPKASGSSGHLVLQIATEVGVGGFVDEHPARVSYLDALQLLLDSHALMVIGYDEPLYAASKTYPYILARKPILAVLHEESSPVSIFEKTRAGIVAKYSSVSPPLEHVDEILARLEEILGLGPDYKPPTVWEEFEPYTARAMAARLSTVLDKAIDGCH
jgi:hypothetical protein